ncbi:class I SAM-dependent methyltransferase [Gallaecimonas sp. GXIMD1310]|uniref:class I SAM-dependent methyltransferase n=1 Tax=Gallaecimonas sp. GXIMD1310 TaxID=3131926 RepID=UPI00325334A9
MHPCPLCHAPVSPYAEDKHRRYWQCQCCRLVFADPASHLAAAAEKAVYDLHQNSADDDGYRRFLERLSIPLLARLQPGQRGLDFGCGPGPVLASMLEKAGMQMTTFDPFYAPDPQRLNSCYDFVTCTEVVEHFQQPAQSWQQLADLVRPGGWLGIMTKLVISPARFASWHYKNDPTHVSFYSEATFAWLASRHGFSWQRLDTDVLLLQKR